MAKITALKVQKKNPNRINVYLDGTFAFGLSRIVAAWLNIGQELSAEKITELQAQDTYEVAYQKAVNFISYRSRTSQEVQRKLKDLEYEEAVIEDVVERLRSNHFLGDAGYAQRWVENRIDLKPRSHRLMAMELRQKGVADEDIDRALEDAPADEELAYEALKRRIHRYVRLDFSDYRKKASAYLGRKGFSYSVISPVIKQVWDEEQEELLPEQEQ
ncbi:MAG: RecX family transcriptional regulator [Anaerolineae bacterium]|nr:RecX family transcriptional regulator [Anaerolineae bacterium]